MSEALAKVPVSGRDHRVDFYRGIALAMIFANHIPGNVWENYTSRNFGFSDAAEIFVFLAGFASAFAYAKPFLLGSKLIACLKAWRRSGVLYLVHVLLTMMAFGLFSWGALVFGRGEMLEHFGLEAILTMPIETVIGIVSLGHQLGYVNILPMYSVILLMLPAMLFLAKGVGRAGMLVAAAALWVAANVLALDMPNYPYDGGWFFNPFAWQFIFALGLYCGLAKWQRGYAVPYNVYVYAAALAYLLFAFVFVRLDAWGAEKVLGLPIMLGEFDKTYVTLPRLLHVLSLIYVFAHAPKSSPVSSISRQNPFAMLGRHSLPIFAIGTVLSLVCQIVKFGTPPSFLFDTALVGAGLAIQFMIARYLDWWRTIKQNRSAKAAVPPSAARTGDGSQSDPVPNNAGIAMKAGPGA